jgi:hypothetical protein
VKVPRCGEAAHYAGELLAENTKGTETTDRRSMETGFAACVCTQSTIPASSPPLLPPTVRCPREMVNETITFALEGESGLRVPMVGSALIADRWERTTC